MGADIHMVLEQHHEDQWVGLHAFQEMTIKKYIPGLPGQDSTIVLETYPLILARQRNYGLFAALAGVRGDGPEPKGLPDDASQLTRLVLSDDSGLHSHTWWHLDEAIPLFSSHQLTAQLVEPNARGNVMRMFGLWGDENSVDYRLCIAFDS